MTDELPSLSNSRIISRLRDDELRLHPEILKKILSMIDNPSIQNAVILGSSQTGKSELLRLTFDYIYSNSSPLCPIYLGSMTHSSKTEFFIRNFVQTLVRHYVASATSNVEMIGRYDLSISELIRIADGRVQKPLQRIADMLNFDWVSMPASEILRVLFSLPQFLAHQAAVPIVVLIDNLDDLFRISPEFSLGDLFHPMVPTATANIKFVVTGRSSMLSEQVCADGFDGHLQLIKIPDSPISELQQVFQFWCRDGNLQIDDSIGRLAVELTGGRLGYLRVLAIAASKLTTSIDLIKLYVNELCEGILGIYFAKRLKSSLPDCQNKEAPQQLISTAISICTSLLQDEKTIGQLRAQFDHLACFDQLITELFKYEFISVTGNMIRCASDPVFRDWVRIAESQLCGQSIEAIKWELLRTKIKSIPKYLDHNQMESLLNVIQTLMVSFNGQRIPQSLLSNDKFMRLYGTAPYTQILKGLKTESQRVKLPRMMQISDGYHFIESESTTPWNFLVSIGFDVECYDQEHEVIWIVAITDSQCIDSADHLNGLDEAIRQLRLTLSASQNKKIPLPEVFYWVISKMGFSPEVSVTLEQRGFASSDFLQVELLTQFLTEPTPEQEELQLVDLKSVMAVTPTEVKNDQEIIAA